MDKKQAPPAGGFPQYALPAQAMPHAQQQFLAQQQMVRFVRVHQKTFACVLVLARPPRARAPRDSLGGLVVGHKKAAVRQALSRAVQGRCPKGNEPRGTRKKMHTRSRAAQPAPPPPSHPLSSSHALRDFTR